MKYCVVMVDHRCPAATVSGVSESLDGGELFQSPSFTPACTTFPPLSNSSSSISSCNVLTNMHFCLSHLEPPQDVHWSWLVLAGLFDWSLVCLCVCHWKSLESVCVCVCVCSLTLLRACHYSESWRGRLWGHAPTHSHSSSSRHLEVSGSVSLFWRLWGNGRVRLGEGLRRLDVSLWGEEGRRRGGGGGRLQESWKALTQVWREDELSRGGGGRNRGFRRFWGELGEFV